MGCIMEGRPFVPLHCFEGIRRPLTVQLENRFQRKWRFYLMCFLDAQHCDVIVFLTWAITRRAQKMRVAQREIERVRERRMTNRKCKNEREIPHAYDNSIAYLYAGPVHVQCKSHCDTRYGNENKTTNYR